MAEYFHHCPKCGRPELKSKKGKTFECTDCGFHFYLNPAAAAAGLLLCERRPGEVLFIKRAKEPKKGRLALVGRTPDLHELAFTSMQRALAKYRDVLEGSAEERPR